MGIQDVRRHVKTKKHLAQVNSVAKQPQVSSFFFNKSGENRIDILSKPLQSCKSIQKQASIRNFAIEDEVTKPETI